MKRNLFRIVFLFLILSTFSFKCYASNVKGYIITLNQDTIYGTIQLPTFNQTTGAYYIKGFDEEYITHQIKFKNEVKKKYLKYTINDILEYGFIYRSSSYKYKRFLLKYKSISNKENSEYRFLELIYSGFLDLYKNTKYLNLPQKTSVIYNTVNNNSKINDPKYDQYHEYYLFSDSGGLKQVELNDNVKTIKDLLIQFNVNDEFLQEITYDAKFSEIQSILQKYDYWLRVQSTK